ncbi:hypothetical protein RB195_014927 [Necator americanus]|uniref:Uncharacterized protein n=1 Tax=Necator americanus TaxID=51031 RepID=A0ABR1E275_NECAM
MSPNNQTYHNYYVRTLALQNRVLLKPALFFGSGGCGCAAPPTCPPPPVCSPAPPVCPPAPVCEPTYASAPAPVVYAPPPQPVYVPQGSCDDV